MTNKLKRVFCHEAIWQIETKWEKCRADKLVKLILILMNSLF